MRKMSPTDPVYENFIAHFCNESQACPPIPKTEPERPPINEPSSDIPSLLDTNYYLG
jgi:hypothetical protein